MFTLCREIPSTEEEPGFGRFRHSNHRKSDLFPKMESYDVIANQPVVIDNVCTLVLLLIVFFPLEIGYKLPVFTADMFDGGRHDSPAVQWSSDGFHVSCG